MGTSGILAAFRYIDRAQASGAPIGQLQRRTWIGFTAVALWDDELEALRPQFRKEAATFVTSVPWQEGGTTTLSIDERVAAHRRVSLGGPPSDKAVDCTIDGPAGTIRLRTFRHEQPKGVLLHIHGVRGWLADPRRWTC